MAVQEVAKACRAGVRTRELDQLARAAIARVGASPVLLGYKSTDGVEFPGAACICVNEEVVHAVPSDRIVRDGDLVTIDLALQHEGWCADAAVSVPVGGVGEQQRNVRLTKLTREALDIAIGLARPGVWWSTLADAAARFLAQSDCVLLSGYCGHGIGRDLHEAPRLCFGEPPGPEDVRLQPGMVLTIEPIVVEGADASVVTADDGWTVLTSRRAWAAHEERTVAITRQRCEVLTT
jgi:methionyl aminopeptidase